MGLYHGQKQKSSTFFGRSFRVVSGSFGARRSIIPGNMDTIWVREFGLATGLLGLDMRIWFGNGLAWFGYAKLDKSNDNWLNYPEGAFSRLLDFCIAPGFWINLMIFSHLIPFLAPSRVLGAPSEVLRLDNFLIYWVFYTTKANFLQFDLDKYKGFWRFYTISKARQLKMSESRAVKVAILDKFRQKLRHP